MRLRASHAAAPSATAFSTSRAGVAVVAASVLAMAMLVAAPGQVAAAMITVDNDRVECEDAEYQRIDLAVAAADPGDTIVVCPGLYEAETVVITDPNITLRGAQAGMDFEDRTFADDGESTVQGTIRIAAEGATVDGFSLTNPGGFSGITVTPLGHDAFITNNIISIIGSPALPIPVTAVYLANGPDGVTVTANSISALQSGGGSAQGILVGDSTSTNPSLDVVITDNLIEDITSGRGAYGVQVNNGARGFGGSAEVEIRDNVIQDLAGTWVHGIGLEGPTPEAMILGNSFNELVASNVDDNAAVHFEANPHFSNADVHENNFDVIDTAYGIKLHPALVVSHGSTGSVDGECNWWNSANGPGPVGPGDGARVSTNVDYSPWLVAPAPSGCSGSVASDSDQCKDGGHETAFREDGTGFKNQGDCIQYVNTGM